MENYEVGPSLKKIDFEGPFPIVGSNTPFIETNISLPV